MHVFRAARLVLCLHAVLIVGCWRPGDRNQDDPASSFAPNASSSSWIPTSPTSSSAQSSAAPFVSTSVLLGAPDVATLAATVRPAVVNITVTEEVRAA